MSGSKDCMVVAAIDIGTTYSGIACSTAHNNTDIKYIKWNGETSPKCPTSALLDAEGQFHSFGYDAENHFVGLLDGESTKGWRLFRGFKMILHTNKNLSSDATIQDTDGKSYPAMDVFVFAIKYLQKHLLQTLKSQIQGLPETDIKYVIVAPLFLGVGVKKFLREAAVKAGIDRDRLDIADESEVAAICCPKEKVPSLGSKLIVADLGGEKGDLSLIQKIPNGRLKALYSNSDTACGGKHVDQQFLAHLGYILGKGVIEEFEELNLSDYLLLMAEFEMKKRSTEWFHDGHFKMRLPETLIKKIHMPNAAALRNLKKLINNKLIIDVEVFKKWVAEPVNSLIKHIKYFRKLVNCGDVKSVLLVGGFAQHAYVQELLRDALSGITLTVPDDCGLAVLRGAVLFGFATVTEKMAAASLDDMDHCAILESYAMKQRKPRGLCIIINNQVFPDTRLKTRIGSDKDRENLESTFTYLGFKVECHENLTDVEMIKKLIDVSNNIDHTDYDCFVCCISTHGELNRLYGRNGKHIHIKELTTNFQTKRCPSLAGKPKLFFLQACQGEEEMGAGEVPQVDSTLHTEVDTVIRNTLPDESDFLLGYSTVPGYVSYRNQTTGSWYIRSLCGQLKKNADRFDILQILTLVNYEVSLAEGHDGRYRQVPAPQYTLRKQLYLWPI